MGAASGWGGVPWSKQAYFASSCCCAPARRMAQLIRSYSRVTAGTRLLLAFADGTFSYDLLGNDMHDGFYHDGVSSAVAYNGYGVTGETIYFNVSVELVSLILSSHDPEPTLPPNQDPTTLAVSLYDGNNYLLSQQTLFPFGAITFNQLDVRSIVLTFTGGSINHYGDGRTAAWYEVSDITYNLQPVPLPAALPLFGSVLGIGGLLGWRRRRKAAALAG